MEGIDSEYPGIYPRPHPAATYSLCTTFACKMRLAACQSSTGLYPSLPATGNQHHTTSYGPVWAPQHNTLQHLFRVASWKKGGRGRRGKRQSSFYWATPKVTKEYMSPVGHRERRSYAG